MSYLTDIKPSTMAVIKQELDSIQLPEHLIAKRDAQEAKEDIEAEPEDEELLASPERSTSSGHQDPEIRVSNLENSNRSIENEEQHSYSSMENYSMQAYEKSNFKPKAELTISVSSTEKPKRQSKISKPSKSENSETFHLEILDVGNKDSRDRKDVKAVWSPNELRADVVKNIRTQIKAAFGAKFEKD